MKKPEKNHNTGLRILEVLKILLNENISRNEIIEKLRLNDDVENIYTQETFLKYFNTLKLLGFDIKKEGIKYSLKNAVYKLNLTSEEIKILNKLIKFASRYSNKKSENLFKNIAFKLDKYLDSNIEKDFDAALKSQSLSENKSIKHNLIKTIQNMIADEQNVSITYQKNNNSPETLILELKDIYERKNVIYVHCYNFKTGRYKNIKLSSIISIKQQPERNSGMRVKNSVIFELYGRLAISYKLKPSEKVIDFDSNHITVSNKDEDKEQLMLRLLKYGENCKIISPSYFKDEFIEMTNEILKNLEN